MNIDIDSLVDEESIDHGGAKVVHEIRRQCMEIQSMLLQKNRAYGNSAITPLRIFSKADAMEQLNVRIDDKLSRILYGNDASEDAELDLIGYLILKRVAKNVA